MASSSFRSCRFKQFCDLKVTFLNDSVSRSKRPLQDFPEGDAFLPPDLKRRCTEGCSSSPCPSPKTPLLSSLLSSPSSGVASAQVRSLASPGWRDDSDLDATLLEPSDGEQPDSPSDISPEDEDKLLEDSPDDKLETFPRLVFEQNANQVGSSFSPMPSIVVHLQSTPKVLEKTESTEPLPPTGLSGGLRRGLACRDKPAHSEGASDLNPDFQTPAGLSLARKSPEPLEAVSVEAASVSLETGGDGCGATSEGAAPAVSDAPGSAAEGVTACESTGVVAEGPSEEQASVGQSEIGGASAGNGTKETGGEGSSVDLPEKPTTSISNSAGDQSMAMCVTNPGGQRTSNSVVNRGAKEPKRPRPRQRICIQEAELELQLRSYVDAVRTHMAYEFGELLGAGNDLHALMGTIQEPAFSHPADLTARNYASRTNRPAQRRSLQQWVDSNQRNYPRFEDIPDYFERSPIPGP